MPGMVFKLFCIAYNSAYKVLLRVMTCCSISSAPSKIIENNESKILLDILSNA